MSARTTRRKLRKCYLILAALLLVGVVVGVEVYRAMTAVPGTPIDYGEVAMTLVGDAQPGGAGDPNGWLLLMRAVDAFDVLLTAERDRMGKRIPPDWPRGRDWPADFASLMDPSAPAHVREPAMRVATGVVEGEVDRLLDQVASTPRAVRVLEDEGRLVFVELPELGAMRNLARLNRARMEMAGASGDRDEILRTFEQMLAMARVCTHQFSLIDHLVGYAIAEVAFQELRFQIAAGHLDDDGIWGAMDIINRQPLGPITLALRGEHLFVRDTIQWIFTDDGHGDGRLLFNQMHALQAASIGGGPQSVRERIVRHPISNLAGVVFAGRKETERKAASFYDGSVAWAEMTLAERAQSEFQPDTWESTLTWRDVLLRMMVPATTNATQASDRIRRSVAATRIMLAIEAYRSRTGYYPVALADLSPGELSEVPIDRYAGGPFTYVREADDRYILASKGESAYVHETPDHTVFSEIEERFNVERAGAP